MPGCHRRGSSRYCYQGYPQQTWPCYNGYPYCQQQNTICTGTLPGGFTSFAAPTASQLAVFQQALAGTVGVSYTPIYVATQLVAGTNYVFVAEARTITGLQCTLNIVVISISQALDGTITLGTINSVIS